MSVLDRLSRAGHLSEGGLARAWSNRGADPHLEACAACAARYAAYATWIEGVGADMRAEADEHFPADRLSAQHTQIMRRLEALGRPARVIAFPRAARAVITGQGNARRWVAGAAAAGLIAGLVIGQFIGRGPFDGGGAQPISTISHLTTADAAARASGFRAVSASFERDDDLLLDAEATARPRVKELVAIDDLTPRTRDLLDRAR